MSNDLRSIRLQLDKIAGDVKKFYFLPSSMLSTEQANNEEGRETYIGSEMMFRWWEGKENRNISSSCCKTMEIEKALSEMQVS
jgi:hypothetical protein